MSPLTPGTQRNVNFQERRGSGTEYPILREHLDFILDGIRHMPDAGSIIEALGWFLLGIGATAAIEAYNADPGSVHRHSFAVVGGCAAVAGIVALVCNRKMQKEEQKHAKWLEKYVLDLYEQFSLQPPMAQKGRARRCWEWFGRPWRRVRAKEATTPPEEAAAP